MWLNSIQVITNQNLLLLNALFRQDLASDLKIQDICMSKKYTINCTTAIKNTQSIVFEKSFYGIQKAGSNVCGYKYIYLYILECFPTINIYKFT